MLHRWHYGQNPYGRNACTRRKTPGYHDIYTEDSAGRIPMGERSHEEKPLLYLTSTQKTLWAEFLWARRLHKKKNPGYHDINTEDSMGRIPMGEMLTWRKSTALLKSTQKTLWAEFLWARRLHKKKNPGYHDIDIEDSMGRIPMGETLTWRKSLTLMTLTQKTPWAEFLGAKRSLEENPLLYWHQHGRLHGRNSYGRTLTWRKTTAPPMLTQKTLWAEFLWAKRLFKTLCDI